MVQRRVHRGVRFFAPACTAAAAVVCAVYATENLFLRRDALTEILVRTAAKFNSHVCHLRRLPVWQH